MHGACSIHEGLKYPLDGVKTSRVGLRSLGRKVNSESLCTPGDQPEKEREGERERRWRGEREKARHGDQSSDGAKVF